MTGVPSTPTRYCTSRDEPMGWTVVTTASAPWATARAKDSSEKSPTCSVIPASGGALPARRTTARTCADRSPSARYTAVPTSPLAPVTTTTGEESAMPSTLSASAGRRPLRARHPPRSRGATPCRRTQLTGRAGSGAYVPCAPRARQDALGAARPSALGGQTAAHLLVHSMDPLQGPHHDADLDDPAGVVTPDDVAPVHVLALHGRLELQPRRVPGENLLRVLEGPSGPTGQRSGRCLEVLRRQGLPTLRGVDHRRVEDDVVGEQLVQPAGGLPC